MIPPPPPPMPQVAQPRTRHSAAGESEGGDVRDKLRAATRQLRSTTTVVTDRDGRQFEESRSNGFSSQKFVGKGPPPAWCDSKPRRLDDRNVMLPPPSTIPQWQWDKLQGKWMAVNYMPERRDDTVSSRHCVGNGACAPRRRRSLVGRVAHAIAKKVSKVKGNKKTKAISTEGHAEVGPASIPQSGDDIGDGSQGSDDGTDTDESTSVTFVTFNIWFAQQNQRARAQSLFAELSQCDADIIALQEVTPVFMPWLLEQEWLRDRYIVSDASPSCNTVYPYGVVILISKLHWQVQRVMVHPLPTNMARRLISIDAVGPDGHSWRVITGHFESLLNQELRIAQLEIAFSALDAPLLCNSEQLDVDVRAYERPRVTVCMGDCNFGDFRAENKHVPPHYMDAWVSVHGKTDSALDRGDTCGGRIDRIFVHDKAVQSEQPNGINGAGNGVVTTTTPDPSWKPVDATLLGTKVGSNGVRPSDHRGIKVVLTNRQQSGCTDAATLNAMLQPVSVYKPPFRVRFEENGRDDRVEASVTTAS